MATDLDEGEDLLEFETLVGLVARRLDERVDEQRVLGDALRDEEDALGDALLLAQRVHGALAHEGGQLAVLLHHLLVHRHRLLVATAKLAVQAPANESNKSSSSISRPLANPTVGSKNENENKKELK